MALVYDPQRGWIDDTTGKSAGTSPGPTQTGWGVTSNPYGPQGVAPPPPPSTSGAPPPPPAATNGSGAPPPPPMTGALSGPGTAEQWWEQNRDRFGGGTRAQDYWNGIAGDFSGGKTVPSATRDAWGTAQGWFAQPASGAYGARGASSSLLGGPGMGESYATRTAPSFASPGDLERYYGANSGYFTTPGAGVTNARGVVSGLTGPTDIEQQLAITRGAGINYGGQALSRVNGMVGQGSATGGYFTSLAPFATGATDSTGAMGYFMPGLQDKSYTEDLYDSGKTGLIDPYARAQEKQSRILNDQMAARGMFNSGAAVRGQEELGADIAAQEANARIALARSADEAHLARAGMGGQLASQSDAASLARRELGLRGASAVDQATMDRINALMGAYGMASGEALQKVGLGTTAASASTDASLRRADLSGRLGLSADEADRARVMAGGELAGQSQTAGLNRLLGGMTVAQQGQTLGQNRMLTGADLGLRADDAERQRIMDYFGMGRQTDEAERAAALQNANLDVMGLNSAAGVDRLQQERLQQEFENAQAVQNLFQNRQQGAFNNMFNYGQGTSGLYMGGAGAANDERTRLGVAQIDSLVAQGALSRQQADQMIEQMYGSAALYLRAKQQPPAPAPAPASVPYTHF